MQNSLIQRYTPSDILPIDKVEPRFSIIENIKASLGAFGVYIDFDNDFENIYDKLFQVLRYKLKKYIGIFYIYTDNNNYYYKYKRYLGKNNYESKRYKILNKIAEGSFNQIFYCVDFDTNKKYLLRKGKSDNNRKKHFENQKKAFYENIKHIVLYLLIRKYVNNPVNKIKFFPEPYYLGIDNDSGETIIIMEAGEKTLLKFFEEQTDPNPDAYSLINKELMWSIYNSLYKINQLGINFKHRDFKGNNLVITKDNKPLIIDFGFSQFTIDGIEFKGEYQDAFYFKNPHHNIIHDMLHLMSSLYTIVYKNPNSTLKPFGIFKIDNPTNLQKFILYEHNLLRYFTHYKLQHLNLNSNINFFYLDKSIKEIFDGINQFMYKNIMIPSQIIENNTVKDVEIPIVKLLYQFYHQYFFNFELDQSLPNFDLTFDITPEQLALDIGINISDENRFYAQVEFRKKYLKYKLKYLELKKLLNKN